MTSFSFIPLEFRRRKGIVVIIVRAGGVRNPGVLDNGDKNDIEEGRHERKQKVAFSLHFFLEISDGGGNKAKTTKRVLIALLLGKGDISRIFT